MGLDIHVALDNEEAVWEAIRADPDYFSKYSLSRTFCNFMCRKDVLAGKHAMPELDQIGRLIDVDISPLYQMEGYTTDSEMEDQLEYMETPEERESFVNDALARRKDLDGNIDEISSLVETVIRRLSTIDNLPEQLDDNGRDTLGNTKYFADFNVDTGNGYIGNNFGQDLRNFRRFLEFAKNMGSRTVYFWYC